MLYDNLFRSFLKKKLFADFFRSVFYNFLMFRGEKSSKKDLHSHLRVTFQLPESEPNQYTLSFEAQVSYEAVSLCEKTLSRK